MNDSSTILVTRPLKSEDPTKITYEWGESIIKMSKSQKFNVIDLKKDDVNYDVVTRSLQYYRPRLYIHIGHGCSTNLQGQKECIITRKFLVDELYTMPNFKQIIQPLIYKTGCVHSCNFNSLSSDQCSSLCLNDTNVGLLNNTITMAIACYSGEQLGKCAVKYGCDAYIGYTDLFLFPTDEMHSQDMFRNVQMVFIRELLKGKTVGEAEIEMNKYEDTLISFYKNTKYIALSLLWDRLGRRITGNKNARIFQ